MADIFGDMSWLNVRVPRLRVSLRIRGGGLDPDFLTQLLGIAPNDDEPVPDEWSYRIVPPPDTELGSAVEALLAVFPDDTTLWEEITAAYTVDVRCEVTQRDVTQQTGVDPDVLAALGRRGLPLALVLQAGDDDDADDGEDDDAEDA